MDQIKGSVLLSAIDKGDDVLKELLVNMDSSTTVKLLVSSRNQRDQTCMHLAAEQSLSKVKMLLDSVNESDRLKILLLRDENDRTALHLAVRNKKLDVCDIILQSIASTNRLKLLLAKDISGSSAIHDAVRSDLGITALILDRTSAEDQQQLLLFRDDKNSTALHYAIECMRFDVVKLLVEKMTSTEQIKSLLAKNNEGFTALHLAVVVDVSFVELLLELTCLGEQSETQHLHELVLAKTNTGATALHLAVEFDKPEVLEYIISKSNSKHRLALLLLQDGNGISVIEKLIMDKHRPLALCSGLLNSFGKSEIIRMFGVWCSDGQTVLHHAVAQGRAEILECVKSFQSEAEKLEIFLLLSSEDETLLHSVARLHDIDMVLCILDTLKDDESRFTLLTMRSADGLTPLNILFHNETLTLTVLREVQQRTGHLFKTLLHELDVSDNIIVASCIKEVLVERNAKGISCTDSQPSPVSPLPSGKPSHAVSNNDHQKSLTIMEHGGPAGYNQRLDIQSTCPKAMSPSSYVSAYIPHSSQSDAENKYDEEDDEALVKEKKNDVDYILKVLDDKKIVISSNFLTTWQKKSLVHELNQSGTNLFLIACYAKREDLVELLLSCYDTQKEKQQAIEGANALQWACMSGSKDMVELLLSCYDTEREKQHAIESADRLVPNALHWACMSRSGDLVELLLSCYGTQKEKQQAMARADMLHRYALHFACGSGNKDLLEGRMDLVELLLSFHNTQQEKQQAIERAFYVNTHDFSKWEEEHTLVDSNRMNIKIEHQYPMDSINHDNSSLRCLKPCIMSH